MRSSTSWKRSEKPGIPGPTFERREAQTIGEMPQIERRAGVNVANAELDEATERRNAGDTCLHQLATERIEHDIHAAPRRMGAHPLDECQRCGSSNTAATPNFCRNARLRALPAVARTWAPRCARDLNGGEPDATGRSMDQHRFAAPQLRLVDQRGIGGDESHRQGRAFDEAQPGRKRHHLRLRYYCVGAHAACRIGHDRLARMPRVHALADAADASRAFQAETAAETFRVRQQAGRVEHLLEIETGRVNLDLDLARIRAPRGRHGTARRLSSRPGSSCSKSKVFGRRQATCPPEAVILDLREHTVLAGR